MSLVNDLKSPGPNRGGDKPPDGWRAHLDVDTTDGGYVVSRPYDPETPPDHVEILDDFGLDPDVWEIKSIRRSKWQTYDERWLEAKRLTLVPRASAAADTADVEQLCERILRWRPRTTAKVAHEGTFVAPVGDTQVGKSDGTGSAGIVERFLSETESVAQRLRRSTPRGKVAERVVIPWLGDCIEGIWSQGGALRMRLDLTPTEQVRVYRRLMWRQIDVFANLAEELVLPVVPGNHDEAIRVAGKMATTYDDSWAIEGASAVQDAIAQNPELEGRVHFRFPEPDELTITCEVDGTYIGMAHGHQFGGNPSKWRTWWNDQAGLRSGVGLADVLLTAHFHHLKVSDHGNGRVWIQIPALDGGSTWFRHKHGEAAPSRMISFWTQDGHVWGLDPVTTRPEVAA